MKKTVLNGQVLSEKEMKEVKGGKVFISKDKIKFCPICRTDLSSQDPPLYTCTGCGSIVVIDENE